jgi:tetratricopeptide (TPR) repeat protein
VNKHADERGVNEARTALRVARQLSTLVPAARILIRAGQVSEARALASEAGAQLPNQHRAYSKIILAEAAMKESNFGDAIDLLTQATRFADVWLARFDLGVAYVQTGHFPEAISEFDKCENRRGEVTALFFDDVPTYRYLVPLRYWKGRALEGVGSRDAAIVQYRSYLELRSGTTADPLVEDARRRVTRQ